MWKLINKSVLNSSMIRVLTGYARGPRFKSWLRLDFTTYDINKGIIWQSVLQCSLTLYVDYVQTQMNAWTTPVWMEAPVRTWWEASSAHVLLDSLERDVKAVSAILIFLISFRYSKTCLIWHTCNPFHCAFQYPVYSETKFHPPRPVWLERFHCIYQFHLYTA